jgi:trimeric autotransporter adhesin
MAVPDRNGGVWIFLGKQEGFAKPVLYAAGDLPEKIAVGDFNGDHILDIAVTNANGGNVSVLLGAGDGTFQPPINTPSFGEPIAIVAGDFNHDGKLDLAVANTIYSGIDILLGNGDGTFQAPVGYTTALNPNSIVSADFNGDGVLDLAVANAGYISDPGTTVSVLIGKSDGTFASAVNYTVGLQPFSVTSADFNGDGIADLAVANYARAAAGDFNGDGNVDLAVIDSEKNRIAILLGNGDGSFQKPIYFAAGDATSSAAVGDFNGDGILDLAVTHNIGGATGWGGVRILLGVGDGTFVKGQDFNAGQTPNAILVADFNGDGKLDLATANAGGSMSILRGHGDGTFAAPVNYPSYGQTTVSIAAGDLNGDGITDIVLGNLDSANLVVYLGQAGGTFVLEGEYVTLPNPDGLAIANLVSSGLPDLVVASSVEDISVMVNTVAP